MTQGETSSADLSRFDKLVDSEFFGQPLQFCDWAEAARALLTAYEAGAGTCTPRFSPMSWGSDANSLKFDLQHALELVNRRFHPTGLRRTMAAPNRRCLRQAQLLLQCASRYHDAVCALTSAFAGDTSSRVQDGTRLTLDTPPVDGAYEVLDGILDEFEQSDAIESTVDARAPTQDFTASRLTVEGSRLVSRKRLHLPHDPELLAAIASIQPNAPRLIADEWKWEGMTGAEIRPVLHALRDFALYRELQAVIAARHFGIPAVPISNLIQCESREQLVSSIAGLTGADPLVAAKVLRLLTYGTRTSSPDPALQPVFAGRKLEDCHLPLGLIGTSRVERNFLALAARVNSADYDRASHVFATAMTHRIVEWLSAHQNWQVRSSVRVPERPDCGDIDILVVDSSSRSIALLELKASLDPADMREAVDRRSTARRACEKHRVRVEVVTRNPRPLLDTCGVTPAAGDWQVWGVVIFSAFSSSPHADVHVVSERLLRMACAKTASLRSLAFWIAQSTYLPRASNEFSARTVDGVLGRVSIQWQELLVDVPASRHRLASSLDQLAVT